ncbi:MAG TPA: DUF1214 domain-containing protein [Chloroflexota bacterium]|nr:DUF1214 domain-containing protein [Chloroflexota bacterium]
MSDKTYGLFTALVGVVCGYAVIRHVFFLADSMPLRNDLVQGVFVGFGLAIVTIEAVARIKATKVNGWVTIFGCGVPGNGILMRAACLRIFPGPVNVPEEAVYWRTNVDGAGHTLFGDREYILHFPPGGLPPNDAFWSLTMADEKEHFVPNPMNRYSVGDRTGLLQNLDGSIDIYLQKTAPSGHETNWLPAPAGQFRLWLRIYMPRATVLDGTYTVRPVIEAKPKL